MQSRSAVFSLFAMILALVLSLENTDVTLAQSNEPLPMPTALSEGAGRNPRPILPIIVPDETEQNIQPTAQPDQLVMPDPMPRPQLDLQKIYENNFELGLPSLDTLLGDTVSLRLRDAGYAGYINKPQTVQLNIDFIPEVQQTLKLEAAIALSDTGGFRLGAGRYTAGVNANGRVTIWRDGVRVGRTRVANFAPSVWQSLVFEITPTKLTVYLNEQETLSYG